MRHVVIDSETIILTTHVRGIIWSPLFVVIIRRTLLNLNNAYYQLVSELDYA